MNYSLSFIHINLNIETFIKVNSSIFFSNYIHKLRIVIIYFQLKKLLESNIIKYYKYYKKIKTT